MKSFFEMSGVKRKLEFIAKDKKFMVNKKVQTKFRRTRSRNMRPKLGPGNVYRYSRYAASGQTFDVTTAAFSGVNKFTLDDVKGYTDFVSLYDQFMISHVQLKITLINNPTSLQPPNSTTTQGNGQTTNWWPKLWYVFDADDDTLISLDNIRERQGVKYKTMRPNGTITINVKPRLLVQTYRTLTTTGYAPRRMFIDVATGQNVPHYGLKFVVDNMGLDPTDTFPIKFRVETKYWLKFKGVL